MSTFLSMRFALARLFHCDENNSAQPSAAVAIGTHDTLVWWPCWVFDNYQQLTSVSSQYHLTNHFQEFIKAGQGDKHILQRKVAYLIGESVPGNRRTVFNPITKSIDDANDELVAQCQSFPGWLQACAEGSLRSTGPPITDEMEAKPHFPLKGSAQAELTAVPDPLPEMKPLLSTPVLKPSLLVAHDSSQAVTPEPASAPPQPTIVPMNLISAGIEEEAASEAKPTDVAHAPIVSAASSPEVVTTSAMQDATPAFPLAIKVEAPMPPPTIEETSNTTTAVPPLRAIKMEELPTPLLPQEMIRSTGASSANDGDDSKLDVSGSPNDTAVTVAPPVSDVSNKRQNVLALAESRPKKLKLNSECNLEEKPPAVNLEPPSAAIPPPLDPMPPNAAKPALLDCMPPSAAKHAPKLDPMPSSTADHPSETAAEPPSLDLKSQTWLLRLDDVKTPYKYGHLEPFVQPTNGTYDAVFRGYMPLTKNGPRFGQGKWACTLGELNSGYVRNFSFWLETEEKAVNDMPLDSARYKGEFEDFSNNTIIDQQIALKFRKNKQGFFNVYGRGTNTIGDFDVIGRMTLKGTKAGHFELYRMYSMGTII